MKIFRFVFRPSPSLAFAICACLALFTSQAVPATAATLTITPTSIWAGHIPAGQSTTLSATLTNSGPETVTVSQAIPSNSAYTVTSPSFPLTLAAGQSVGVTILFAPQSFHHSAGTIAFISDADDPTLDLMVSHRSGMSANVSASPSSVSFGNVSAGGKGSVFETLTNGGSDALTISSVNTGGTGFASTGIAPPVILAPGSSITFEIWFTPTTSGAATGSLTVVTGSGGNTLTIPLSGNATASGTLNVSPASGDLGSVAVGSSSTMSATLSAAGSSVVVSSASTTSPEFTVTGVSFPLTIAAGNSVSFGVIFSPSSSGSATGKLSFVSNAGNSPAVESLTGAGAAATQHNVALSWQASSSTVAGYNVYRGANSGGPYSKVNASADTSTSYSDPGVQAGQTYYYVVTGVNSQGTESSFSNQVAAVVP
jgi:Abnormal spindle-like microcephaly-assoc'd, ASPM-SPD-2-Hydin